VRARPLFRGNFPDQFVCILKSTSVGEGCMMGLQVIGLASILSYHISSRRDTAWSVVSDQRKSPIGDNRMALAGYTHLCPELPNLVQLADAACTSHWKHIVGPLIRRIPLTPAPLVIGTQASTPGDAAAASAALGQHHRGLGVAQTHAKVPGQHSILHRQWSRTATIDPAISPQPVPSVR
jgi:hypothetical protein